MWYKPSRATSLQGERPTIMSIMNILTNWRRWRFIRGAALTKMIKYHPSRGLPKAISSASTVFGKYQSMWWNGRHACLRCMWRELWGFKSPRRHHFINLLKTTPEKFMSILNYIRTVVMRFYRL